MAIIDQWMISITGRPGWPGWHYIARKFIKYTLLVPPVYLRAKYRKAINYQPELNGKPFLFVCGLHRSGTSLVHRLLRAHPKVSGIAHTTVQEDEGQHLQTVFMADSKYGPLFAFNPQSHLTDDSPLITVENRKKLLREWGRYLDFTQDVLIEKSPSNILRSRFLQALFPESCFVYITRHPIPTALAVQKWTKELARTL